MYQFWPDQTTSTTTSSPLPPHPISSAWNTLLSCHWPCREQPILRNCTWPSHCISINHTFPMRSAICFKVMGGGERSIETRLAMIDNCSAGIWVFFKIYSLLWYVVELFHFKTFLKSDSRSFTWWLSPAHFKVLESWIWVLFLQPQSLTPWQHLTLGNDLRNIYRIYEWMKEGRKE